MNNTSSTVLNFKFVVHSMRSCPKIQALSLKVFYHYIFEHCPKTQALSLKEFLLLYFRSLSQNPSLISISFLSLYFRTLSQNPSKAGRPSQLIINGEFISPLFSYFLFFYGKTFKKWCPILKVSLRYVHGL